MKAKSNNYRGKVDISVSQNFITSKNTIDIDNVKENVNETGFTFVGVKE